MQIFCPKYIYIFLLFLVPTDKLKDKHAPWQTGSKHPLKNLPF